MRQVSITVTTNYWRQQDDGLYRQEDETVEEAVMTSDELVKFIEEHTPNDLSEFYYEPRYDMYIATLDMYLKRA